MILIIVTYLAGVLTILSPCILPVLPFVFSRAQNSFIKSGLPLLAGMCITFSLFSALAIVGGEWIAQANEWGRIFAVVLLTVFGLSLIFPELSEKMMAPLVRLGSRIGGSSKADSIGGSFLIGISTGLLWAPCAGPILGLVLTGAATQGNVGSSIGLLIAYSLGAATSLAIALVAGNKFLGTLKKFLGADQVIKKTLGIAVLVGVLAIIFNLDRTILTQFSKVGTVSIENKLLALTGEKPAEAIQGPMPELIGATSWLNSDPLTKEQLKGKVVLIDFWTYSCINCLRTLPYVKSWFAKYRDDGLVVIGVHTPEFGFEKNPANVKSAIKDIGITYPVALDNDYVIWKAFKNRFWPAHYFIDRSGMIRHIHTGEGQYEESEKMIRELLSENGNTVRASTVAVQTDGVHAAGSGNRNKSPETYIGYWRAEKFVSVPVAQKDVPAVYKSPAKLKLHEWALDGNWQIGSQRAFLIAKDGKISFRFIGRDLNLVLGSAKKARFRVMLDGKPLGQNHGVDTGADGTGEVREHRLYQLIRNSNQSDSSEHIFEIEFLDPGVEAYAFTFG